MPIVTYYNKWELDNYLEVKDKELDKLYQEVRQLFDERYYLIEKKFNTNVGFLRRENWVTYYKVIYRVYEGGYPEFQILNFPSPEGGFNEFVSKSTVETLFLGLINGYNYKNKK